MKRLCNLRREGQLNAHGYRLLLLVLLHKFHKGFLMYQARIVAILQHAEIPQAQFGKALVDEVDGGVHVQGDGCL